MEKLKIEAEWSGKYPCLCSGSWTLVVNGKDFSSLLDDIGEMDTKGNYASWSFNEDWLEEWDWYEDGLDLPEWAQLHENWLSKIAADPVVKGVDQELLYGEIYKAIQSEDWRHNSCGGCI